MLFNLQKLYEHIQIVPNYTTYIVHPTIYCSIRSNQMLVRYMMRCIYMVDSRMSFSNESWSHIATVSISS